MHILKPLRWPIFMVLLSIAIQSCRDNNDNTGPKQTKDYSAEVCLKWNTLFLEIDRYAPGYRPPAAARALAYMGLAAYEAAVPGMPDYHSMRFQFPINLPTIESGRIYHWPTCINSAYNTMFQRFYPNVDANLRFEMEQLSSDLNSEWADEVPQDVIARSKAFGESVANAVYDWSTTDTFGHNAYLDPRPSSYVPPVGPGLWQPTYPDYTPALFPYWGKVRPFALHPGDDAGLPPIPFSEDPNSAFYQQAKEVQVSVDSVTQEAHEIAIFWSDDIFKFTFEPAGRWVAIANQVVEQQNPSLEKAVELYAKLGMALCDVGIAVWSEKYKFNVERPVSYIRRNIKGDWVTALNNPINGVTGMTPEFPAYPSGHSGFGGAAAVVLEDLFGGAYAMIDNSHLGRIDFLSKSRPFFSFRQMAFENAYSRIPLGVHFRMDCDEGLRVGYLAGKRVIDLPWKK